MENILLDIRHWIGWGITAITIYISFWWLMTNYPKINIYLSFIILLFIIVTVDWIKHMIKLQ